MNTNTTTNSQFDKALAVCTDALAFVAYCEAREAGKSHIAAMAAAMAVQTNN